MPTEIARSERLRHSVVVACGGFAVVVGLLVLVGWATDIAVLKSGLPGFATMKANTAVSFVLLGISLVMGWDGPRRRIRLLCGLTTFAIAFLTLAQSNLALDFGIDQLLFSDVSGPVGTLFPGRMPSTTATTFLLLAAALLLFNKPLAPKTAQAFTLVALLLTFLSVVGYLYGADEFHSFGQFGSVAIHTTFTALIVCVGVLAASPNTGLVGLLAGDGVGSRLARRLLPAAIILPVLIGWGRLAGQRGGWYDTEFGLALFVVSNITVFSVVVVWTASQVQRSDAQRQAAGDWLRESERRFRVVVETSPFGLVMVNRDGRIVLANTVLGEMFGHTTGELLDRPIESLIPERYRGDHLNHRLAFLSEPQPRAMGKGRDLRGLRKDGSEFPVEVGLRPVTSNGEEFVLASVIDITDRKQAQLALQQSERQYRMLLEGVPQLVWTCRTDGWCDYLSRQWLEYTGVPEADQLGYGWSNAVHPEDRPTLMERWERAVDEGGPFDVEFRIRAGSGEYRWFQTRAVLFNQDDGSVKWFGTNTDIHDRKLAEEQLRELNASLERRVAERTADLRASEARLRLAAEAAGVGVWEWDLRTNRVHWNDEMFRMYQVGSTPDGYVSYETWRAAVLAEDLACQQELLQDTIQRGGSGTRAFRIRWPDGQCRFIEAAEQVRVNADGRAEGVIGTNIDVTARKVAEETVRESEQRFRNAFEYGPIGMALVGPDGRWLRVNRSLCEMLGYTEAELLASDFQSITHPDDLDADLGLVSQVLVGTLPSYQLEKRYFHKDGHVVHTLLSVSVVRDGDGRPAYFVSQIEDISQRNKAERELAAHDALLRQFIKYSPAAVAMFDRDVRYIQLSDRWLIDYNLSDRDVIGRSHYDVFPDIPDRWRAIHQRVLAGSVEKSDEDPFVRADGSTDWLRWECHPWHDAGGKIGGLIMFTQVITESKRATEALRASEERFQAFIDNMPAASWLMDADGQVVFVNRYYGKMAGVDPASLTGKTAFDMYTPGIAVQHQANDRHVLATRTALETTEEFIRPDQTQGIVKVVKFPLPGPNGQVLIGGVAIDITELTRHQKELVDKTQVLETVLDSMGDAVLVADRDGKMLIRNRAFHALHDDEPNQIPVDQWSRAFGIYQPGSQDLYPWDQLPIFRAIRGEPCDGVELEIVNTKHPNGMVISVTGRPLIGPEGILGGVIVSRDVTERRRAETALQESEERYRSVIESLAEGIVVHSADGSIVASNDRASQILGLSPDQIAGRTSLDPTWGTIHEDGSPFPGDDHPAMVVLQTGNPVFSSIMGVRKPSGDFTWVTVNAVSIRSVDGTPHGVVASFHDITESRRLHQQVRASLQEKEVLLKEIHHRVKNNLQIISALLELQAEHTEDEAALSMFQESRGRVKSMALIHERLYRSQDVAHVDFSEYVRQLAEDLYRSYKVSDDDIRLELDVDIPPVPIDIAIPCGLLLNELMSNCFKHAFKDAAMGCIRVTLQGGKGEPNVLTVSDDGAGFPVGTDFRNTTSFGLQLVGTLVNQLDGEVELTTARGTTFTVRFPKTKKCTHTPRGAL